MISSFQTERSGGVDQDQTAPSGQGNQSDQGIHCLSFRQHLLDAVLYTKVTLLKF